MEGLAALMKNHGDTLASLAEEFSVDENTVWRWKAGHSLPKIDIQRRLCQRYNCSFDTLLNPPQPSAQQPEEPGAEAERKKTA